MLKSTPSTNHDDSIRRAVDDLKVGGGEMLDSPHDEFSKFVAARTQYFSYSFRE